MDIQITTKKSEGVERLLEVSVPLAIVRAEEDKQARRYATSVRLPGFRPGKAPAAMVKKRFKDAIRQQVLEALVQEAFKEVMDRVVEDRQPVVFTRQKAESVVMVSLADWNAMEETLHLLSSPANAARLRESIAELDAGGGTERELIEP